jgi:peptidoglycan/xylan/chitin deacetylase (PgdA/CDA1 family)
MTIERYYPGFVRKAITFTIDDGNLALDKKLIDIVKPHGIKGTFNLCSPRENVTPEEYRALYSGFGIANHCKNHPLAMVPGQEYKISKDPFDPATSDKEYLYNTDVEGYYRISTPRGWRSIATYEAYVKFIDECKAELEAIFGEGSIRGFVWPFYRQADERILEYVKREGYGSARRTGALRDSTGFSTPKDRLDWTYNTGDTTLLEVAELYESLPDDGELKFFSFGVHSSDFENNNTWQDLISFAEKFGDRPDTYWYATVDEIFDYEDALGSLTVNKDSLYNGTDITLYIKVNGKSCELEPKGEYKEV